MILQGKCKKAMFKYNLLDMERQQLLTKLKPLKGEFYLAGGTGLALQTGHRISLDFDFFTQLELDTSAMFLNLKKLCSGFDIVKIQEEKNTLSVLFDKKIKVSFFTYPYNLLHPLVEDDNLGIASIEDIGCMKFSAIVSRATMKDYIDLYFILQNIQLIELLKLSKKKYSDLDENLILKSLVYFEDIESEQINFCEGFTISFEKVKEYLKSIVMDYMRAPLKT